MDIYKSIYYASLIDKLKFQCGNKVTCLREQHVTVMYLFINRRKCKND